MLLGGGFVGVRDGLRGPGSSAPAEVKGASTARFALASRPILFEKNAGQAEGPAKFLARGSGVAMQFTEEAAYTAVFRPQQRERNPLLRSGGTPSFHRDIISQHFVGANPDPVIVGEQPTATKHNYFLGDDPNRWQSNVETYRRIRYQDLYPGIDLVYHGEGGVFEYDFHVRPGADPALVTLQFDPGQQASINARGELEIALSQGATFRHGKPVLYQEVHGARVEVEGAYALLADNQVGFSVFGYDPTRELVIDPPVVGYSTYLGGGPNDDDVADIVVDTTGNVYAVGWTGSANFPVKAGGFQTSIGGLSDFFVTKIAPPAGATPASISWSTFVGGAGHEVNAVDPLMSIARDSTGRLAIAGTTGSVDFPKVSAIDSVFGGDLEAVVFILNSTGSSLLFSSYYGGSVRDEFFDCKFDSLDNLHLAGTSSSSDLVMVSGYDSTHNGFEDVIIVKINTPATAPVVAYSTYYGGAQPDQAWSLALFETGGTIYDCVVGHSYSGGTANQTSGSQAIALPTFRHILAPADQSTLNVPGGSAAFFARFAPPVGMTPMTLDVGTYFGAGNNQRAHDLVVTANQGGDIIFCGYTDQNIMVTVDADAHSAFQTAAVGGQEAWITQLDLPTVGSGVGNAVILFSSYLAGEQTDVARGLALDTSGGTGLANERVWVCGATDSSSVNNVSPESPGSFPVTGTVLFNKKQGSHDVFVARVFPGGDGATTLQECGYYGGNANDQGQTIAINPNDPTCPYIGGSTGGGTFPVYNGPQANHGGEGAKDGFVAQICGDGSLAMYKVDITQVTTTTARVTWQTNRPASTTVNFGTTTSYGSTQSTGGNVINHSITITGLTPQTVYHLQAQSTDGLTTVSSSDLIFITCPVAPKLVLTLQAGSVGRFDQTFAPNDLTFFNYIISNTGFATANNVRVTANTLTALGTGKPAVSSIGGTVKPHALGAIGIGGSSAATQKAYSTPVSFRGKSAVFRASGTFTGGSWASTIRFTLPS